MQSRVHKEKYLVQLYEIFHRVFTTSVRSPLIILSTVLMSSLSALMVSGIYY